MAERVLGLLVLGLFLWAFVTAEVPPQIEIEETTLNGVLFESFSGKEFYGFLGIPYAEPPVGPLRFKNPEPFYLFPGEFDATNDTAICPQLEKGVIIGQEDCLYLNVYIPKSRVTEQLDVMVWIHGGGFDSGAGTRSWYGPEYLFDQDDIILVTINYRLGPLGFLSTEDVNIPGNFGLKDQQLALIWVQNYIHFFNGNPNSVTLFGGSSGAASVHLHTFAPGSDTLFHRVILQSGTAFQQWVTYEPGEARAMAKKFAKEFKCPDHNSKALVNCLRHVSVNDLIAKSGFNYVFDTDPLTPFRPVYSEPKIDGAFLIEDPMVLIEEGRVMDIPWMVGLTTDEGAGKAAVILNNPELTKRLNEEMDFLFPLTFAYNTTSPDIPKMNKFMLGHYMHHRKIDKGIYKELSWAYMDSLILSGLDFAIRLQKFYLESPVYYYSFGYRGTMSLTDTLGGNPKENYGVAHGDDLFYLFKQNPALFWNKTLSDEDVEIMKAYTKMYTDFAKTGVPYGNVWEPTSLPFLQYLEIKSPGQIEMSAQKNFNALRVSFWYRYPYNRKINFKYSQMDSLIEASKRGEIKDEL